MDPDFWHRRWDKNEIGFHEGRANSMLTKHWASLGLPRGSTVFVPLCGKAIDMAWLAAQGHRVLGVELSAIAARDFFREHGLEPEVVARDGFEVSRAGGIEIWCGDLFKLQPSHLAGVIAIYDRAALVALPPAMQELYIDKIAGIMPLSARILLIAFNYDQSQAAGPPFATPPARVHELCSGRFAVTEIDRHDVLELNPNLKSRGLTWLEEHVMMLERLRRD